MAVDLAQLTDRYVEAQIRANRQDALRLLLDEGYHHGAPVRDLLLDVIRPAQYRIGTLWEENRIGVAEEHAATAISQVAVAHLAQLEPPPTSRGVAIAVACVPGEQHDLGARIVADLLDAAGFGVAFLGANVPVESLVEFVRRTRPALTALSVTMPFHLDTLRDAVEALRGVMGAGYPIAAGGEALVGRSDVARQLGLVDTPNDGRGLAEMCALSFPVR